MARFLNSNVRKFLATQIRMSSDQVDIYKKWPEFSIAWEIGFHSISKPFKHALSVCCYVFWQWQPFAE